MPIPGPNCAACGRTMALEEKDTSSGRDRRTYRCPGCGSEVDVDQGKALWQRLSDEREAADGPTESG